jgi:hypothetical protein
MTASRIVSAFHSEENAALPAGHCPSIRFSSGLYYQNYEKMRPPHYADRDYLGTAEL